MTISKLRVTGLCVRNSPVTGEFPTQRASNAENVSIWWRHHVYMDVITYPFPTPGAGLVNLYQYTRPRVFSTIDDFEKLFVNPLTLLKMATEVSRDWKLFSFQKVTHISLGANPENYHVPCVLSGGKCY